MWRKESRCDVVFLLQADLYSWIVPGWSADVKEGVAGLSRDIQEAFDAYDDVDVMLLGF